MSKYCQNVNSIIMIFCVYFSVILLSIVQAAYQYETYSNKKNKPLEINVILFFVNSSNSDDQNNNCAQEGDPNGIVDNDATKYMNFSKATVIVPCTPEEEAKVTGGINRILRYSQNSCDCEHLFKNSLKSLIGYARNFMGLTTAISSITEMQMKPRAEFFDVNQKEETKNVLQSNEKDHSNIQYRPYTKFDPNRWSKNQKTKRDLLAGETVEVFNLSSLSGMKQKREEIPEIADIPSLKQKPKNVWDAIGLMKIVRESFFDNFFNPIFDPKRTMVDEEDGLNLNLLGRAQKPSMFELVRRTLRQLDMHKSNNGFLATFFGGKMCDIKNPRSDLMRSIKHVLENADEENTLTVLTGSCPREGRINSDEKFEMPLYVKGPRSEILATAKELFDVPKLIRVAMKEHHKNKKRYNKVPEVKKNL